MNWYKKADSWYKFAPTITLYHGTTEANLKSILQEGLKPFDPEKTVDETLGEYGFTRQNVPYYIWEQELRYRKQTPHIYLTTSKEQAKQYSDKSYGEFKRSIIDLLIEWQKEQGKIIQKPESKPVVITIDIPWEAVKGRADLKEVYERVINIKDELLKKHETLEGFLESIPYEFIADKPIPKEYMVNWEYV